MTGRTEPRITLEVGFASDPGDTSTVYTALSSYLLGLDLDRGKFHELDQIDPGVFSGLLDNRDGRFNAWNRASPYYGNLLTENQSSLETNTTGWAENAAGNVTISRTTSESLHGSASLQMQRTGTNGDIAAITPTGTSGVRADPGQTFTAMAWFKNGGTARSCDVTIVWYDQFGAFLDLDVGTGATDTSGWVQATVTATAPANTSYMAVNLAVRGCVATEVHFADQIGIFGSANPLGWTIGGRDGLIQPGKKIRLRTDWNLLTENQASVETDTTGWAANNANTTIGRSTAHFTDGAASLQLQRTGTDGTAAAITSTGTAGVRADPGETFSALASFEADSAGRASTVSILWYDQFGVQLSGDNGTPVTSMTGGWVQATVTATAPANTSYMAVQVSVASCVATEVHYVDKIGLFPVADITTWSRGGPFYLFTGFVERWTQVWDGQTKTKTRVVAVDGFKRLARKKIASTAFYDAQVADSPDVLYRFAESGTAASNGVVSLVDSAGSNTGSYFNSPEYGADGALPTEANPSVRFSWGAGDLDGAYAEAPSSACPSGTNNFTVEAWIFPYSFHDDPVSSALNKLWFVQSPGSQQLQISILADGTVRFAASDGTNGGVIDSTVSLDIGRWNHVVCVKSGTAGPSGWAIYIDGVDVSDHAGESVDGTGNCSLTAAAALLGGRLVASVSRGALDARIDEVAIYKTSALSSARVAAHFAAAYGFTARALSGTRIGKLLDLAGWPAGERSIDTGQFYMAPVTTPLYQEPVLSMIQKIVKSEDYPAAFFMGGAGYATFHDRDHAVPSSSGTFGDGASDWHFVLDGNGPERDDSYVINDFVRQSATGASQQATDSTSADRYGEVTDTATGLLNDDNDDLATVTTDLLATFKDPSDRLPALTVEPWSNPGTLFPAVLGAELQNRYTVRRLGLFQEGGDQFSLDSRLEHLHQEWTPEDGWLTQLAFVPA